VERPRNKPDLREASPQQPNDLSVRKLALDELLCSIPHIGPDLDAAVFTRLNEIRFLRLERLTEELNLRFAKLGADPDFVRYLTKCLKENESFMVFVRKCLERLYEEHDVTKFNAYKQAFINGVTGKQLSVNVKLELLRMLDRIGLTELHVLGYMKGQGGSEYLPASRLIAAVSDDSECENLLVLSAVDTLANLQLVEVGRIGVDDKGGLDRRKQEYRLTQLGQAFIAFIQAEGPEGAV